MNYSAEERAAQEAERRLGRKLEPFMAKVTEVSKSKDSVSIKYNDLYLFPNELYGFRARHRSGEQRLICMHSAQKDYDALGFVAGFTQLEIGDYLYIYHV
jgi:hypothetical protein